LGNPRPIPEADQKAFGGVRLSEPSNDGRPSGRAAALWRYYLALTDSA
jgi:hypothetical protein